MFLRFQKPDFFVTNTHSAAEISIAFFRVLTYFKSTMRISTSLSVLVRASLAYSWGHMLSSGSTHLAKREHRTPNITFYQLPSLPADPSFDSKAPWSFPQPHRIPRKTVRSKQSGPDFRDPTRFARCPSESRWRWNPRLVSYPLLVLHSQFRRR